MQNDYIGTASVPRKRHRITLTGIAGTYAIGDVLSTTLHTLSCVGLSRERDVRIVQVDAWEKAPAGAQAKPAVRVHFFRTSFTPAANNAAFIGPASASYTDYLGYVDVESALYVEVGDGTGTDPDYAFARKVLTSPPSIETNADNALFALVEIREAKTLGDPTEMVIDIRVDPL